MRRKKYGAKSCSQRSGVNSKQRDVLSAQELQKYSADHVWHEIKMFFGTGPYVPYATSPQVKIMDDAMLESFVLHLRNLMNFFYPGRIMSDDVIAADYFDSGQMPELKSKLLPRAKDRADKELSHLTSKRLPHHHPDKFWESGPLMRDLAEVIEAFIRGASPHKLDTDFVVRVTDTITQFRKNDHFSPSAP
jgi:hypothetical protein